MSLPICHVNPYDAVNNFDEAVATVGGLYAYQGNEFMFVKNAGSGAGVAGELCGLFLTTPAVGEVTCVSTEWLDGTLGTVNPAMGMVCVALDAGNYAYILRRGWTTDDGTASGDAFLKTDGGVVKGDYLVPEGGASPDGTVDTAVAGEEHAVVGYAISDDTAGSLVIAWLNCQ